MLINRTRQRSRKQPNYFKAGPAGLPKPVKRQTKKSKKNQTLCSHEMISDQIISKPKIKASENSNFDETSKIKAQAKLDNTQKQLKKRPKRIKTDKIICNEKRGSFIIKEKGNMVDADEELVKESSLSIVQEVRFGQSITDLDDEYDMKPQLFPSSKVVCEDIECGTGLAFRHWDSDMRDEDEKWLDKYSDRIGVRKWVSRDRKSATTHSWEKIRYRSNFLCDGINLHLGNHRTSASAAAAIDLANILLLGSEDCKPLHVLSSLEAGLALKAAGVRGIFSGGRVEPLDEKFFTEDVKNSFVKNIDSALASIGGQDDLLSSIICSLDGETVREAEIHDKKEQVRQRKRTAKLERRAKAQEERQAKLKESKACLNTNLVENNIGKIINIVKFEKDHGIFEVDDDGKYTWVKNSEFHTAKALPCVDISPASEKEIQSTTTDPEYILGEVKRKCSLKSSYLITDFFSKNILKSKDDQCGNEMDLTPNKPFASCIGKKLTPCLLQEEKKFCQ